MITSIVDTFNGLPLHVFVVHAAVVLVPLAALSAMALLRPSWRGRLVRLVPVFALVAWALVWLARESGEALEKGLGDQLRAVPSLQAAVEKHAELSDQLNILSFALLVLVTLYALVYARLTSVVATALAVVIALVALAVIGSAALTGEQGARAAWNHDGSMDYSVN